MLAQFNKKNIFPSKAKMNPLIKAQKISLISNHFPIKFADNNFSAFEWHISFLLKSDIQAYRADATFAKESAIAADNRILNEEVLSANRRELHKRLGANFYNGAAFYNFRKNDLKEQLFTAHDKYILILVCTPNQFTLSSLVPCEKSRMKILQLLNSQVKYIFKDMNFVELGFNKKYYDRSQTQHFSFDQMNFSIMKGFGAVFESYEGGLKLQLDYSSRIICEEDLWTKIKAEEKRGIQLRKIAEEWVCGKSFMTSYGNQKLVIIDDIDSDKTPLSPFPNPEFKDYQEYFFKTYNIKVKDPNQYLLVQNKNRKVTKEDGSIHTQMEKTHYLPELLKAEGIPDKMRKNMSFMKEISSRTIVDPKQRFEKTQLIINQINQSSCKAIDFQVEGNNNQVTGYRFDPPKIMSDPNNGFVPKDDRLRITKLAEKKPMDKLAIVYDGQSEPFLNSLYANLEKAATSFKFGFQKPVIACFVSEKVSVAEIVTSIIGNKEKVEMVLVFVGRRTAGVIYKEMKKRFNKEGILTQFFASFNPNKDSDYSPKYNNIVLQMQAKMGSNLWFVENNLVNTLVLGADVYHSRNNKSVASLVGQFGKNLKHTYSTVSIQTSRYQEIIASMSTMFLEILEHYQKTEKKLPERILFYRDGVGQSFIEKILEEEVSAIIKTLETKYALNRPKITVVLVTKRISDKFACVDKQQTINPPSGTIVESGVVEPDKATFFMVSQKVTQGSANPTKYQVVYDEGNTKFEDLIRLTRNLCWGYFNWLGPVKVPAPVQYAHKNCYLIGELQDSKVHKSLKKHLYFL